MPYFGGVFRPLLVAAVAVKGFVGIGNCGWPQTLDERSPGQACEETADWIADAAEKAVLGDAWEILTCWDFAPSPRDS